MFQDKPFPNDCYTNPQYPSINLSQKTFHDRLSSTKVGTYTEKFSREWLNSTRSKRLSTPDPDKALCLCLELLRKYSFQITFTTF